MNVAKVMLLIDADNVSADVVEQAVEHLLADYGALHVRRAYCNAETALKHQALYKRLWIRPMVNLAAGKNCTDIALAIDALDLVVAERPEVVVIASSDSDFAPLVARLREKGCRVCGIGQQGKTSEDTERVYDSFVQFAPRGAAAKRTRRSAAAKTKTAAPAAAPAAPPAAKTRRTRKSVAATSAAATAEAAAAAPGGAEAAAVKSQAARSRRGGPATAPAEAPAKPRARRTRGASRQADEAPAAPPAAPAPPPAPPPAVAELLRALPELLRGETLDLQKAAEVLRKGGLLSRSSSAPKLFGRHPEWFTLQPPGEPRQVTARQPGSG